MTTIQIISKWNKPPSKYTKIAEKTYKRERLKIPGNPQMAQAIVLINGQKVTRHILVD